MLFIRINNEKYAILTNGRKHAYTNIYRIVMNSWIIYKSIRSLIYSKEKYMFMFRVESLPCSRLTAFISTSWLINGLFSSCLSSSLFVLQIEVNSRVTQKNTGKKKHYFDVQKLNRNKRKKRNNVEFNNDGATHSKYLTLFNS